LWNQQSLRFLLRWRHQLGVRRERQREVKKERQREERKEDKRERQRGVRRERNLVRKRDWERERGRWWWMNLACLWVVVLERTLLHKRHCRSCYKDTIERQ
jgi:hypothetical protein